MAAVITTGDTAGERVWEWADDSADFAELDAISHWALIPAPPKEA